MRPQSTPPELPAEIRKVAVFRALQLGDMLCAVPALRGLRQRFPEAEITLVGLPWASDFAKRFAGLIDDFVPFPGHPELPEQSVQAGAQADFYASLQGSRFDLAIQLHGSGRISNGIVSAFGARSMLAFQPSTNPARPGCLRYPETGHEIERLCRLLLFAGWPCPRLGLEFPLTAEDLAELRQSGLDAGLRPGSYCCIHAGARHPEKCWPAASFAQVADRLAEASGLAIVLTGSAAERERAEEVAWHMKTSALNAAAPISIGAMAALMSRARLLVCNDTGVSHMAVGLGLPSVVLFSSSDPQRWAPLDRGRHPAIVDPAGLKVNEVVIQALALLDSAVPWRPPSGRNSDIASSMTSSISTSATKLSS